MWGYYNMFRSGTQNYQEETPFGPQTHILIIRTSIFVIDGLFVYFCLLKVSYYYVKQLISGRTVGAGSHHRKAETAVSF
jgi:hypothetical protein